MARKAGLDGGQIDQNQPLLLQLLGAFNSGAVGSGGDLGSNMKPSYGMMDEMKKIEPLSFKGIEEKKA